MSGDHTRKSSPDRKAGTPTWLIHGKDELRLHPAEAVPSRSEESGTSARSWSTAAPTNQSTTRCDLVGTSLTAA